MPLQRQTIHFPLAGGLEQRTGKLNAQPPQLTELVNARWIKQGMIGKRPGFARTGATVNGGVTPPIKWGAIYNHNGKTIALTDVGPYVYSNGAWEPVIAQSWVAGLFASGAAWVFGQSKVAAVFDVEEVSTTVGLGYNGSSSDVAMIYSSTGVEYAVVAATYTVPASGYLTTMCAVYVVETSTGKIVSFKKNAGTYTFAPANVTVTANYNPANYGPEVALAIFGPGTSHDLYSAVVAADAPTVITFSQLGLSDVNSSGTVAEHAWDVTQCTRGGNNGFALVYNTTASGKAFAVVFINDAGAVVGVPATPCTGTRGQLSVVTQPGTIFYFSVVYGTNIVRLHMSDGSVFAGPTATSLAPGGAVASTGGALAISIDTHVLYATLSTGALIATTTVTNGKFISKPFFITRDNHTRLFCLAVVYTSDDSAATPGLMLSQPMIAIVQCNTDTDATVNPVAQLRRDFAVMPSLTPVPRNVGDSGRYGQGTALYFASESWLHDGGNLQINQHELLKIDTLPSLARPQSGNGCVLVPGIQPLQLGTTITAAGAPVLPPAPVLTGVNGGSMTQASPYTYMLVLEWYDSDGGLHQSAPSLPAQITLSGGHYSVSIAGPGDFMAPDFNDETRSRIIIYRSAAGKTEMYRVAALARGSTPYVDLASDVSIEGNAVLYSYSGTGDAANGGEVENLMPLAALFLVQTRDRIIYVPSERPTEVRASKPFVAQAGVNFHPEIVLQLPKPATNGGTLNDTTIIFAADAIYRLDGDWPDQTGAGSYPLVREIARGIGCVDEASCYETPVGLLFKCASNDTNGWMLLDLGFSLQPIGASVMDSNDLQCVAGQVFGGRGEVWLFHSDGTVLVYDWVRQQWTTHTIPNGTAGLASATSNGAPLILLGDGGLLTETPSTYVDGITDDSTTQEIPTTIATGWYSFAGVSHFQRLYEIILAGEYFSPHTLTVELMFDYVETVAETHTLAVAADLAPYQVKVRPTKQRCQAVKMRISDSGLTGSGRGFALEDVAFSIGLVSGLAKTARGKVI